MPIIFSTRSQRGIFSFLLLGLTLLLGACGGGGSNLTASTPPSFTRDAFVANESDGSVSSYVVDVDTGRLHYIGKAAVGTTPRSVAITGQYAYVANAGDNTLSQFTIETDGKLTAMTPATVSTGTFPNAVTIDPSGQYTYVANLNNSVSQYTIGADGSLSAMSPAATVTTGAGSLPVAISVDLSGKYAYIANNNGTVSQFSIGADGSLTAMSTPTVTLGGEPVSIVTTGSWQ